MDTLFLTGCDSVTEWQLPWFVDNFRLHNPDANLAIADFGMSDEMLSYASSSCQIIIAMTTETKKGWMKKPHAMLSSPSKKTCWLDTDCQVLGDLMSVFDYVSPNKLSMVEDRPWTTRRGEKWHNSGVVAYAGRPKVLIDWAKYCQETDIDGDQEVLHWMMGNDQLRRITYIEDLPHKYNVLRIDLLDNNAPKEKLVMHWTGRKGNDEIRRMMSK